MLPILLSVGPFKLHTLGLIIPVGVFLGLFVIWRRGKELHFEEKDLFDVIFTALLWMFIGSRIGYVLVHFPDFGLHIGHWLNVFTKPGWYFPSGLLAAAIAVSVESKKRKWEPYQVLDVAVTGLVLTQAITALGMFLSGLGYGLPTDLFFGMRFPGVFDRRYPVQLFELVAFGSCFAYLWRAESVYRTYSWYKKSRSQAATGFLVSVYLIWWGVTATAAALLRTLELVVYGVPVGVIIPFFGGVIGGLLLLISRSGASGQTIGFSILDYFGLAQKKPSRR
jgi:phosphatidylglycerol:prolipoprotein diacylglycerol transferase